MTLSEKEKMLAGELYRCSTDPELQAALAQAQQHLRRLNAIAARDYFFLAFLADFFDDVGTSTSSS